MPKDHRPPNGLDDHVVMDYHRSLAVIRQWVRDLLPDPSRTPEREDGLARALVARLAQQTPPLTISVPEDWS